MNGSPSGEGRVRHRPESLKPSRKEVLDALKHASNAMAKDVAPLEQRYQEKGAQDLNGEEKALLADYHILAEGRSHAKKGNYGIEIKWEDPVIGKKVKSKEGIPSDGLIRYLEKKIKSLEGEAENRKLSAKEAKQIEALKRDLEVLDKSSVSFERAREDNPIEIELPEDAKDKTLEVRQRLEAVINSKDPLRQSENPDINEFTNENWYKAQEALARRRELTVPEKEDKPASEPTPKPEPSRQVSEQSSTSQPGRVDDFDFSQPEGAGFAAERFFEDDRRNPAATVTELEEARRNKRDGQRYAHQEIVDQMDNVEKLLDDPQVQGYLAKNENETPEAFRRRLLRNLRVRLTLHGNFENSQDQLFQWMKDNLKGADGKVIPSSRWDGVLMGAEALEAANINADNAIKQREYEQKMYSFNQRGDRRRPAYGVDLGAEHQSATVALMQDKYTRIDENGRVVKERAAEVDLVAFELVSQVLMDLPDANNPALGTHADGRPRTYGEVLHSLKEKSDALISEQHNLKKQNQELSPEKQQQLDKLSQQLLKLRESFYHDAIDVLEKRQQHNPFNDKDSFRYKAFEKLYGQGEGNLDLANKSASQTAQTLIDYYKRVNGARFPTNPTPDEQSLINRIQKRFDLLTATSPDIIQLALKGADLMKRRIEALPEKPKLEKVATRIYHKTFVDKGFYRGPADIGEAAGDLTVPTKTNGNERSGAGVGGRDGGRDVPAVPTVKDGETVPPVPANESNGEKNGGEPIPEMPAEVESKPPPPEPAPHEPGKPPSIEDVPDEIDLGLVDHTTDRVVQTALMVGDHMWAKKNGESAFHWAPFKRASAFMAKVPILSNLNTILSALNHPVKYIWQNQLMKHSFQARERRLATEAEGILRNHSKLTGTPIEISVDLMDKAREEGKKLREQEEGRNILKRIKRSVKDLVVNIAPTQTYDSEMEYAKKWLQSDTAKSELSQNAAISFEKATQEANRYAISRKGLSFEEQNRLLISQELGETRVALRHDSEKPEQRKVLDQIKDAVLDYQTKLAANPGEKDNLRRELFLKVNEIRETDDFKAAVGTLSPEDQKKVLDKEQAIEHANSVLTLADQLEEKGIKLIKSEEKYLLQVGDNTKDFNLNLYFGTAEYMKARGRRETSFNERLALRMGERNHIIANAHMDKGRMIAEDLAVSGTTIVGGAILGNIAASLLNLGPATALRLVTFGGGMGTMAAIQEAGLEWGDKVLLKGRYQIEGEQAARERALGRLTSAEAMIRNEVLSGFVEGAEAKQLIENINKALPIDLSDPSAEIAELDADGVKNLLLQLADVDARLRLSDRSDSVDKDRKLKRAQNFIRYSFNQEQEENTQLRGLLLNGMHKVMGYLGKHDDIRKAVMGNNTDVFSLDPDKPGLFEKYSHIMEAQLRYGSQTTELDAWLQSQRGMKGVDSKEREDALMRAKPLGVTIEPFADPGKGIWRAKEDSMAAKEQRFQYLRLKRGAKVMFNVAAGGFVAGAVYSPIISEINDVRSDITEAGGFFPGLREYKNEWIDIAAHGKVPLTVDNAGNLTADLSINQKAALWEGNIVAPPFPSRAHTEVIDGVRITLPGELNLADETIKGKHYDGFVDNESGRVYDLSQYKFATVDTNNDGVGDKLILQDNNGNNIGDAETELAKLGITGVKVTQGENIVDRIQVGDTGHKGPDVAEPDTGPDSVNIPGVDGHKIWDAATNYRVVHPQVEGGSGAAMSNSVFATGNEHHPFGVRFEIPDNQIHNPNTGATEYIHEAADQGRLGMLWEIPGYGPGGEDVSVWIPGGKWDETAQRYVMEYNPADTTTMITLPDGSKITMAAFAQNVLNEQKLEQHGEGVLGSELTVEGREYFNGANPDGLMEHQMRIHFGYIDPNSKNYDFAAISDQGQGGAVMAVHSIHGSGPLNLAEAPIVEPEPVEPEPVEPQIPTGPEYTEKITPTFNIEYQNQTFTLSLYYVPFIYRENIEKSVPPGDTQSVQPSTVPTDQTPAQSPPIVPDANEERNRLEEEKKKKEEQLKVLNEQAAVGKLNEEEEDKRRRLEQEIAELDAQLKPKSEPAENDEQREKKTEQEKFNKIKAEVQKDLDLVNEGKMTPKEFELNWGGLDFEIVKKDPNFLVMSVYLQRHEYDLLAKEISKLPDKDRELYNKVGPIFYRDQEKANRVIEKMKEIKAEGSDESRRQAVEDILKAEFGDELKADELLTFLAIGSTAQTRAKQIMQQENEKLQNWIIEWIHAEPGTTTPVQGEEEN